MITSTQNVRTVALMFIVLIYLVFGATVFNALESKEEATIRSNLRLQIARILFKNETILNESSFNYVTSTIFENRNIRPGTTKQWTFPGAFYFSTLLITLIGYGHMVPKTVGGKIFCMVYTVAGVPLNLIMFQSVGERLNAIISFVLSRIKRLLGFRHQKVSGFELITVEFGMSTMLVLCGSLVFAKQEKWGYFESIYYSLVTFWTIGFGDLVPLVSLQRSGKSLYSRWGYFIFTTSYILFGLAIMASSLNLLVLRLVQFHSENGLAGISALLGRNEEDLIAAAIAEHRASIQMQQRNRIYSNSFPEKNLLFPMKNYSCSSRSETNSSIAESDFDWIKKQVHQRSSCSLSSIFLCRRRKKRHWHLRRSPQNIKHLIHFNQFMENHRLTIGRKSLPAHSYIDHPSFSKINGIKEKRVSI